MCVCVCVCVCFLHKLIARGFHGEKDETILREWLVMMGGEALNTHTHTHSLTLSLTHTHTLSHKLTCSISQEVKKERECVYVSVRGDQRVGNLADKVDHDEVEHDVAEEKVGKGLLGCDALEQGPVLLVCLQAEADCSGKRERT